MRFIGDAKRKPGRVVGRASDESDPNLSDNRGARDTYCATSRHVTRCNRQRCGRPNGYRDVCGHDSTFGGSDSIGHAD